MSDEVDGAGGEDVIVALIKGSATMLAMVPADRVKISQLPDNIALPALVVRTISGVDRQTLDIEDVTRRTERIEVVVRAPTARTRKALCRMVRRLCAGATGTIAGLNAVAVLTAGTGPDLIGPGNSFERGEDFLVGFDQPE